MLNFRSSVLSCTRDGARCCDGSDINIGYARCRVEGSYQDKPLRITQAASYQGTPSGVPTRAALPVGFCRCEITLAEYGRRHKERSQVGDDVFRARMAGRYAHKQRLKLHSDGSVRHRQSGALIRTCPTKLMGTSSERNIVGKYVTTHCFSLFVTSGHRNPCLPVLAPPSQGLWSANVCFRSAE